MAGTVASAEQALGGEVGEERAGKFDDSAAAGGRDDSEAAGGGEGGHLVLAQEAADSDGARVKAGESSLSAAESPAEALKRLMEGMTTAEGGVEEHSPAWLAKVEPPWRQPRGKSYVNLPQMPPDSGGICMGVD